MINITSCLFNSDYLCLTNPGSGVTWGRGPEFSTSGVSVPDGGVKSLLLSNGSGEDRNLCFVNACVNLLLHAPKFRYLYIYIYIFIYIIDLKHTIFLCHKILNLLCFTLSLVLEDNSNHSYIWTSFIFIHSLAMLPMYK